MQNPLRHKAKIVGGSFCGRRETKASIVNVIDGCNNAILHGSPR